MNHVRASAAAGLMASAILTGCGPQISNAQVPMSSVLTGSITGYAEPCEGALVLPGMQKALHQDVTVEQEGRVITKVRVTMPFRYRLTLTPGTYTLMNDQGERHTATVLRGRTSEVNFPSVCL